MADPTSEIDPETLADWHNRTVVSVHNLRWADAGHEGIDCEVLFAELEPMGHIPFTAIADADTEHGRLIWNTALAGDYGEIAEYLPPTPTALSVDAERDRRIASGFDFNGVRYQSRPEDRENMAGASTAALAAMMNGAQPNNLRWHGGDSDFVWIAEDNSLNPMDAQTVFALGQAAMAHKQAMIFAARAIKDADPIPADFATNASYWP